MRECAREDDPESLSGDDFPSLFPGGEERSKKDQESNAKGCRGEGPGKKYPEAPLGHEKRLAERIFQQGTQYKSQDKRSWFIIEFSKQIP